MGVELATDRAGFHEMEEVNFSDSELVYHVRHALQSVPLVSILYSECSMTWFYYFGWTLMLVQTQEK